jgi:hypothetical protein
MNLTAEQVDALKHGDPVRICPTEVGEDCVMLRADVFERVQQFFGGDLTVDELRAIAARTFEDADTAEPIRP